MELDLYQVDAFATSVFKGNPAAICPLDAWLDDDVLQSIALENNLAETAFFIAEADRGAGYYHLRWFTPTVEVDLCGHATLASAHVLWTHLDETAKEIVFATRSGDLRLVRQDDLIVMDFPSSPPPALEGAQVMSQAFETPPLEILGSRGPFVTAFAVFRTEKEVREFTYTSAISKASRELGLKDALIITAPADEGSNHDCVSRFFAPYAGIPEDPVTGSIHTSIVPYWASKLGKPDIQAYQASSRGGTLDCTDAGERVIIRGQCVDYMKGKVSLP